MAKWVARLTRNVLVVAQWVARLTRHVLVLAQWVARLTQNVKVMGSSHIKVCFLEQETLPLLLRTGWFQERIRAGFQNQTKIN